MDTVLLKYLLKNLAIFGQYFTPNMEKEMETHSSILAWRIPGMGEPGGLLSMESHRVGHNWSDLAAAVTPNKETKNIFFIPSLFFLFLQY